jgi:hypothetical protein
MTLSKILEDKALSATSPFLKCPILDKLSISSSQAFWWVFILF